MAPPSRRRRATRSSPSASRSGTTKSDLTRARRALHGRLNDDHGHWEPGFNASQHVGACCPRTGRNQADAPRYKWQWALLCDVEQALRSKSAAALFNSTEDLPLARRFDAVQPHDKAPIPTGEFGSRHRLDHVAIGQGIPRTHVIGPREAVDTRVHAIARVLKPEPEHTVATAGSQIDHLAAHANRLGVRTDHTLKGRYDVVDLKHPGAL